MNKDQAQMLATLARDVAREAGKRWDEGGLMDALGRIRHWSLTEAIAEANNAAADPNADTPGVIGRQGRRWAPLAPPRPPDSAPVGTRCTVCGGISHSHSATDHPHTPPQEHDYATWQEHLARLRSELAPTSGPTSRRSLEEMAEANPELHDRLEKVRAMIPDAVTKEAE